MAFVSELVKPKYLPLDIEDSDERDDLSGRDYCRACNRNTSSVPSKSCIVPTRFWVLTTFLLLFILGAIIVFELSIRNSLLRNSDVIGFSTEMSSAKSKISFRQVPFTGNINFFENGSTYLERDPGSKLYAGTPTDEIDENWRYLVQNRYFYMTEAEVLDSWGSSGVEDYYYVLSPNNERRYIGGLDTLHTLHCVDQLRQTLDRDRYPKANKPGSLHLYHCIDHIRQWIMCSGDFTPIPTRWHPETGSSYVDTDQVHTCRNFDVLWNWVQKRESVHRF
ncbi:hypothetical protein BP6252_10267 [Coleophoma cylindrospora]|uniref:Uncharacterized protein n=1 Tax=Coleophoma cylindrospora TaxID=1849047 RepID=A0A3D8QS14_9HELO|nr:hypothetical protein BP6252_10267 [Coleophoma cylindrospora]